MKKIIFTSLHLYIFTSFLSCTNSEVSRYSQVPDEWTRGDTITFDFDSIDAQGATLAVRYDDSYPYRELKLMVEIEGSNGSRGSSGSRGSRDSISLQLFDDHGDAIGTGLSHKEVTKQLSLPGHCVISSVRCCHLMQSDTIAGITHIGIISQCRSYQSQDGSHCGTPSQP